MISAIKQSGHAYKPIMGQPMDFEAFVRKAGTGQRFLASYRKDRPDLSSCTIREGAKEILIGPEGDFTAAEISLAENMGYQLVNLGKSRLRTETAGILACVLLNYLNNE